MDELPTCSMNCPNRSVYVCDCSDKKVFLCLNHIGPHGELTSARRHLFTRIMKNPDCQTKIIISDFLKGLKHQTKQDRLKVIQESSLLITHIIKVTDEALEKLLNIEKRLNEYIYLCDTLQEVNNLNSESFIESLLKLSAEDAAKIKYQEDIADIIKDNLTEKIENLFIIEEADNLFDINNLGVSKERPIIKYFVNQTLYAVDVISLSSNSQNINKNWKYWDPTCLLNDGSVFCCFQSETFIISPNNSITALDSSQYSNFSGLIAVDDFVYMFGGYGNASLKFSLKSKNWATLAQYPISNNRYISCASINGVILIVGYESPYISVYNIRNNSYENAWILLNSGTGKNCLSTKSKAYVIDHNRNSYESGFNDINTWTSIGANNVFQNYWPRHSYSLLYEDSFYFITIDFRLIQFDFKNKQLKHLKTLN